MNLLSSTVCLPLKGYIPFFYSFIGKEFTQRKGIANRVDCFGLEIGLLLFLCNPIERQTHSLVPCCNFYTVAILIFFLPCLSHSVCRFSKTSLRVTERTVVQQNGSKKAIFSFRKIRKIGASHQQYEGDKQLDIKYIKWTGI